MVSSLLTALFNAIADLCNLRKSAIEHSAELNEIKDKKQYKKATNIAEKIIVIADKYEYIFDEKDKKLYEKLKKQFFKYN